MYSIRSVQYTTLTIGFNSWEEGKLNCIYNLLITDLSQARQSTHVMAKNKNTPNTDKLRNKVLPLTAEKRKFNVRKTTSNTKRDEEKYTSAAAEYCKLPRFRN